MLEAADRQKTGEPFTLTEFLKLGVAKLDSMFYFEGLLYEKLYDAEGKLDPLFTADGNTSRYRFFLNSDDYDYVAPTEREGDAELEKKLDEVCAELFK
jgi:hypothetical protein